MARQKPTNLLSTQEATRLLELSLEMADLAERALESRGAYGPDFVRGLERSFKEKEAGRVKKINSLADLK